MSYSAKLYLSNADDSGYFKADLTEVHNRITVGFKNGEREFLLVGIDDDLDYEYRPEKTEMESKNEKLL